MSVTQDDLESLAAKLGEVLLSRGWQLAAAESCTGGWAAQAITAISGSSAWFDRGFVTYSNEAKREMLGVRAETLAQFGAVSEETVREMAEGAMAHSRAQTAIAISGIAGPSGGSPGKPVGTVWFAWAVTGRPTEAAKMHFAGDRREVRAQAVAYVFSGMQKRLDAMQ
jgi:nicotinamide-nucleotide amidase